ncbi:PP2C family protein-serine/threonine phosphatase [Anaeromicropila herbilytica]|uniref:Serine/threonine phosphatase n=1 Tax=Anaeromicropila herbilytica TaxID=2785025 RepID=A0A7R7IE40_9FIRM|nr:protein phosphatase 2C domain-containing protein [Anaeromicropila herbilytica]BCN32358.1 serine/threonine phosphatase [Anaeromicropila herbilytica]
MSVKIKAGICTSAGNLRTINEDNFLFNNILDVLIDNEYNKGASMKLPAVFAVCDGMGGLSSGKKASSIVVNKINEQLPYIKNMNDNIDVKKKLENVIQYCNSTICQEGQNMGTTLAFIYLSQKEIWISNIGDSRIYQYYDNQLIQISVDHNCSREFLINQIDNKDVLLKHNRRNELTQYLGIQPSEFVIEPHYMRLDYKVGTMTFLLCSDGINESLTDEQISYILGSRKNMRRKSKELVMEAMKHGSKDNITAIVIKTVCK